MSKTFLPNPFQWLAKTPERAIAEAYKAAVSIKKLEEEYFNGNPVSEHAGYSENTYTLFLVQLQKHLRTIDVRLIEYKLSCRLPFCPLQDTSAVLNKPLMNPALANEKPSPAQQLAFIDFILSRYRLSSHPSTPTSPANDSSTTNETLVPLLDIEQLARPKQLKKSRFSFFAKQQNRDAEDIIIPVEKSIIPGSFLRTFERIFFSLGSSSYASYEREVVDELRQSRQRITEALRAVIILAFITIAVQVATKNLIYSPIVDRFNKDGFQEVEFSMRYQEEAIAKLREAKEQIEFQRLIHGQNAPSMEESEEELRRKAIEIVKYYDRISLEGIKNFLADVTAVSAFYFLLAINRRQVRVLKDFLDETLYSLNDNAKAFLIIVSTDTFVGYHSSDGWDALLNLVFGHLGIPENRIFIMTFIATVPVFLDGLFKFWIFQYLRQSSPATAAIYGEMKD